MVDLPEFIHRFSEDGVHHTYRGSLKRHLVFERLITPVRAWLLGWDATWLYAYLNFFVDLTYGFNCNFPPKDVLRYAIWAFRINSPLTTKLRFLHVDENRACIRTVAVLGIDDPKTLDRLKGDSEGLQKFVIENSLLWSRRSVTRKEEVEQYAKLIEKLEKERAPTLEVEKDGSLSEA